jgi:hypothetical protein
VDPLFRQIRSHVASGRYVVGQHAVERLEERGILEWQVVDGIEAASLIAERPNSQPNPTIEVRQTLADGTPLKAVWALLIASNVAKLVTVHFFDR